MAGRVRAASNHPGLAIPKGPTRKTLKRRRKTAKNANIADVRTAVERRDSETCRITRLLKKFGFTHQVIWGRLELAHIAARGMGGNPDLSRDTPENTVLVIAGLHQGGKYTMHGEYVQVEALTDAGANGPIKVTFYEKLPSEISGE